MNDSNTRIVMTKEVWELWPGIIREGLNLIPM